MGGRRVRACVVGAIFGVLASALGSPLLASARAPLATSLENLVAAAEESGIPVGHLNKLDSGLQRLATDALQGRPIQSYAEALSSAEVPESGGGILTQGTGAAVSGDRVLVDAYVRGQPDDVAGDLRELGMRKIVVSDAATQRLVEGWLPVHALVDAAELPGTRALLTVPAEQTNAGSVLSEGDAAHFGPAARALGPTGSGVKVGVISNSMNRAGGGVAGSQATGDLPGPASSPAGQVQILRDGSLGSNDEGRAMAEIIFDTAPGIRNMLFTTGTGGAATRAAGIDSLVAQGVNVIADDAFQITEPFFQDGIVAQAVDRARAAGVTYLVSAGNRARQSWERSYTPMTDPRGVSPSTEDFDPGAGTDAIQTIGTFTNRTLFVSLQWDEPFGGNVTSDFGLDVYVVGNAGPARIADFDNLATHIPGEFDSFVVSGTATIGIAIRRNVGTGPAFLKYITGGAPTFTIAEHATNSSAIDPDAASANGALTVAASNFATPATPEAFSSRGPVTRFFDTAGNRLSTPDVRAKPDLAAADGVATSVSGFNPFFGTSAAAPSAAGVATLMRSANPSLTAAGVEAILTSPANAIDCTATPGVPDLDCGSGFILANSAVTQAQDNTPPVITPTLDPAAPNGTNGFYTSDVKVAWGVVDPNSPLLDKSSSCNPSAVTSDGTTTVTCSAKSVGGSADGSTSLKRDASPPGTPTFTGIKKKKYPAKRLPKKAKIRCESEDSVSGVEGCVVTGFSKKKGKHRLTARATNGAGLTAEATLRYSVR